MKPNFKGLLLASHFGPTLTVTLVAFLLAKKVGTFEFALSITVTVLLGQFIVGWSNDLFDYDLDKGDHTRSSKPLVSGLITRAELRASIFIALCLLLISTYVGSFGIKGGTLHLLGVGAGVAYNFYLKFNKFSPLAYAIAFAALPASIVIAAESDLPFWLPVVGAILGISAHFVNVLKDMESDQERDIYGAPQILGLFKSKVVAAITFILGATILASVSGSPFPMVIALAAIIFFLPVPRKVLFPVVATMAVAEVLILILTTKVI